MFNSMLVDDVRDNILRYIDNIDDISNLLCVSKEWYNSFVMTGYGTKYIDIVRTYKYRREAWGDDGNDSNFWYRVIECTCDCVDSIFMGFVLGKGILCVGNRFTMFNTVSALVGLFINVRNSECLSVVIPYYNKQLNDVKYIGTAFPLSGYINVGNRSAYDKKRAISSGFIRLVSCLLLGYKNVPDKVLCAHMIYGILRDDIDNDEVYSDDVRYNLINELTVFLGYNTDKYREYVYMSEMGMSKINKVMNGSPVDSHLRRAMSEYMMMRDSVLISY